MILLLVEKLKGLVQLVVPIVVDYFASFVLVGAWFRLVQLVVIVVEYFTSFVLVGAWFESYWVRCSSLCQHVY